MRLGVTRIVEKKVKERARIRKKLNKWQLCLFLLAICDAAMPCVLG